MPTRNNGNIAAASTEKSGRFKAGNSKSRSHSRPPHPRASASQMRSLTDLLGPSTSRAESALGHSAPADAWSSLGDTVQNLPAAQLSHPGRSNHLAHAAHAASQEFAESDIAPSSFSFSNIPRLPLDLSLKTAVRISSSSSLQWTRFQWQRSEYLALRSAFSQNSNTPVTEMEKKPFSSPQDAYTHFYNSLLHFRYPSYPLSSSLASNWRVLFSTSSSSSQPLRDDSNTKRLKSEALDRLGTWQSAWRSLYYAFRDGHISLFYVLLPSSTVVFSREQSQSSEPVALLSPASPGLRSLLGDYIVPFTICRSEAQQSEKVAVLIKGTYGVHTLYNFIMCAAHKLSGANDVPTIICDQPFLCATSVRAEVQFTRQANKTTPSDNATSKKLFVAQIAGILTPRQVNGIVDSLAQTQKSQFSAVFNTEARCVGTNILCASLNPPQENVLQDQQILTRVAAFPEFSGIFASYRNENI